MSWWGSGSSDKDSSSSPSNNSYDTSSSFGSEPSTQFAAPSSSNNLQEQLQLEQQKAMIQTVMLKLTDIGFEQCVSKPSSSLSSSEVGCINSVVSVSKLSFSPYDVLLYIFFLFLVILYVGWQVFGDFRVCCCQTEPGCGTGWIQLSNSNSQLINAILFTRRGFALIIEEKRSLRSDQIRSN